MSWTGDHGPDELYDKFEVRRKKNGEPLPEEEFVFVLRPERDESAYWALRTYAAMCSSTYPNLARQISAELDRIALKDMNRGGVGD